MKNDFMYSDTNKRYYTYDYYNRQTFGKRMYKVPLSIAVTCPNRDGKKGVGGCVFCSSLGSGNGQSHLSIKEQIERERNVLQSKGRTGGLLAYFQSYTNTYGDAKYLEQCYMEALASGVDGLIIATRGDSISSEILDILTKLNKMTYLIVELGLQTTKSSTIEYINRCESLEEFEKGYYALRDRNIKIGIHIIDSLPYESYEDMMNTAKYVADIHPDFLKIHALHIIKGTRLADMYEKEKFELFTRDEYIKIVCDQLEILPSDIVIERLTGDGQRGEVIAPIWTTDKLKNLNGIDKELAKRESYQGKYYLKE